MAPGFVSEIQTRHRPSNPSNTNSEQASSASTNENKLDLKSRFGISSTENGDDSSSVSWEDFAEESFDSMVVPDVKIAAELGGLLRRRQKSPYFLGQILHIRDKFAFTLRSCTHMHGKKKRLYTHKHT